MNISPRTLQAYRDTGKISFSRINHKIYYKVSDIEILLKQKSKFIIINNYGELITKRSKDIVTFFEELEEVMISLV